MKKPIDCRGIIRLLGEGESQSGISKQLHVSKSSVSAVAKARKRLGMKDENLLSLPDPELYGFLFPEKRRTDLLLAQPSWREVHEDLADPEVSLRKCWKEYQAKEEAAGFSGMGYSAFCEGYAAFCRENRLESHARAEKAVVCAACFGHGTAGIRGSRGSRSRKVHVFAGLLAYSGILYLEAVPEAEEVAWCRAVVHMLAAFGGVPDRLLCQAGKGKEREKLCGFYGMEIEEQGYLGRCQEIADHAVSLLEKEGCETLAVCRKLLQETAGKVNASHEAAFLSEREKMRPLPEEPYRVVSREDGISVGKNCHIYFRGNYYSVPYLYRGEAVTVVYTEEELQILAERHCVAVHRRFPEDVENRYRTVPEHMPPEGKRTSMNRERMLTWAGRIGPGTQRVISDVFRCVEWEEQGYHAALAVLQLAGKFSEKELEEACQAAFSLSDHPRSRLIGEMLLEGRKKKQREIV